jgi:5'-nucleotidase
MRILISNDDGIYSPGILALAEVAQQFGEVHIVAPDVELVIRRPIHHRLASAHIQAHDRSKDSKLIG